MAAALGAALSCANAPAWLGGPECLVVPVSSQDFLESTRLRARMSIGDGHRELQLEVIAQLAPDDLVVVGLAPHGTRLFAVRQRGQELTVEGVSSLEMKYVALWVMDALHRGLWIEPPADSRLADRTSWNWHGERVLEARQNGHRRREYRRLDERTDVAPVVIDYREAAESGEESGFEIRNAWCGYEAVLVGLDSDH